MRRVTRRGREKSRSEGQGLPGWLPRSPRVDERAEQWVTEGHDLFEKVSEKLRSCLDETLLSAPCRPSLLGEGAIAGQNFS